MMTVKRYSDRGHVCEFKNVKLAIGLLRKIRVFL